MVNVTEELHLNIEMAEGAAEIYIRAELMDESRGMKLAAWRMGSWVKESSSKGLMHYFFVTSVTFSTTRVNYFLILACLNMLCGIC